MNFRNLSALLFVAACGGGGGQDPVVLVDGNNPPPSASNSANDMVLVTFDPDAGMLTTLTSQDDQPDNQAAPLTVTPGAAFKLAGESGVGGDASDEYKERDTFLIHTDANTNQMTIRMAWDDGASDHDYVLFEEPAAGSTDLVSWSSGTLISNVKNEFDTFVVKPNTNYWLWSGVYQTNADDGNAPGAAPTLPSTYDLSLYGETFTPAAIGNCNYTEAADGTNDHLSTAAPTTNKPEVSGQALTTGTHVYCGKINKGHFVVDPQDNTTGTVDIDAFSLDVNLETDVKITMTGVTAADQAALDQLQGVEFLVLNQQKQFFQGTDGFIIGDHGVLVRSALPLSSTTDTDPQSPTNGQVVGPKSIAIIAANGADIPADINYKLEIKADVRDTRAPRVTAAANVTEAHDN